EIVIVEAEEVLDQEQVAGRGHRQELGQALDDAEDEGLEKIEQHDGLRKEGVAPRSTGRGRSGRRGFPASLTSEQRGRANIAQVAPGRPYPKGREHPNVTAAAWPACHARRPPQSLRPHADTVPPPVLPALAFRTLGARRIRHR